MKGEKMGCNMMREEMFVQCCAFRSWHVAYLALKSERCFSVGSEKQEMHWNLE